MMTPSVASSLRKTYVDLLASNSLEADGIAYGQSINEIGSGERIATNTDDQGLTEASLGGLVNGLVGEGSGTGNNSNSSWLMDVSRHDTDLALARPDDTRAVRTNQSMSSQ
jgi:hypothetical protein